MRTVGIDIGSRSMELVLVEDGSILEMRQSETGYQPLETVTGMLEDVSYDAIRVTGYGRHLMEVEWSTPSLTEIKAYALGARRVHPSARTILDIGGQDTKVIALRDDGRIRKFEMNDRCAAGTGKFLEIMAEALDYSLDEFGAVVLGTESTVSINSMCAVFAESEVTSLVTSGKDRASIARGLHESVAKRAISMLSRINWEPPLIFAGGVALNRGMVKVLQDSLNTRVIVPENPQYLGAIGAALS